MTANVYQMVTDRIVEQLDKGIIPWQKPWSGACLADGGAINYVSRKPYSFLNQLLLGKEGEWLTFKQIKDAGGNIKKGSKAGMVVFFKQVKMNKTVKNEDGSEKEEQRLVPILRYFNVFHIDDTEGVGSKIKKEEETGTLIFPIDTAEEVITGYLGREKALKFHNDKLTDRAFYSPSLDMVSVPMLSQYEIPEEYYSTTFHELVHSTKAKSRCDRDSEQHGIAAFGNEDYSREELVAEIGSAMLCNKIGIECEKAFKNSVAYIQGWLKALKNDNRAIVWASSRAEIAAKFILTGEKPARVFATT
ncbi:MAG: ssDNA-binding domain-containing protein [Bacteroidales bacterium]|nr:ssDNA-binding domain-containing protein [Bacteroidales bacterium]